MGLLAGGLVLLLLLVGGGILLARSSGDDTTDTDTTLGTSPTTNTTNPATSTSTRLETSTSIAAPVGTFTKPGTQLKFGEKALVPLKSKGVEGTLGVTATGIKKGDPAELARLNLGDRAAGLTPYYVTFVLTNESGTDFAFASTGSMGGQLGDGSRAQSVFASGFPPCPRAAASRDFTTKGATFTTCTLTLAGGSSAVTAATYGGSGSGTGDTDYFRDPIIWK